MKHYLQCDHCGHFNFVKSEYLIFCEKCDKKLTNNYKDWYKKNPDGTLEEFKMQKCVSEDALSLLQEQANKKPRKKLTKAQLAGIIAGIVFTAVGSHYGSKFGTKAREKLTAYQIEHTEFATTDTTNWFICRPKAAGFEVAFPDQPKDSVQMFDSQIGKMAINMQMHQPEFGKDENILYFSAFIDYPKDLINRDNMSDDQLEVLFKNSIDGAIANIQGKLLSVDKIQLGEVPGREFKADVKNGLAVATMRIFLVHNRMCMLQVISPAKSVSSNAMRKFFRSFKLTAV